MHFVLLAAWTLVAAAKEPPTAPAVAWVDCAPWDGPAFTVAVGRPGDKTVDLRRPWLRIAIWHEASSRHGVTYRFPDTEGTTGAVAYEGSAVPSLTGTVRFPTAAPADQIMGTFELVAPDARRLSGQFRGGWRSRQVFCGT